MDPGNWGTDLAGRGPVQVRPALGRRPCRASWRSSCRSLSARLGVVTGKDLAQACRDYLPGLDAHGRTGWPASWPSPPATWPRCSAAPWRSTCCSASRCSGPSCITAFDVLLLLALQGSGCGSSRPWSWSWSLTIGGCYFAEIFVLPQTQPELSARWGAALARPGFREDGMIVVAIGIIGATVMPHNLYLHSALVQSRQLSADEAAVRRAIRFNTLDTVVALVVAFLVNAAILVLAAMTFYGQDSAVPDGPGGGLRRGHRLDPGGVPDADARSWAWRRPAPCSRWPCWPAGRAARSPARWPGRS